MGARNQATPLSLLTFLLDNRREELPESVGYKLDVIQEPDAGICGTDAVLCPSEECS